MICYFLHLKCLNFVLNKTQGFHLVLVVHNKLAGLERLVSEASHFDELEEQWPEIKEKVKESHFGEAMDIFRETLQESFTFKEALDFFKVMRRRVKDAEQVSYAEDDPFIGLGVLFVFGYLFRHGKLPPEVKF